MRNACRNAACPTTARTICATATSRLKIREGIPVTEVAAQVGHARKSMTLDVYSHVLIDE